MITADEVFPAGREALVVDNVVVLLHIAVDLDGVRCRLGSDDKLLTQLTDIFTRWAHVSTGKGRHRRICY